MARRKDGQPRSGGSRFSRSGHTTHLPYAPHSSPSSPPPAVTAPVAPPPPPYQSASDGFGNPTYHHTPAAARSAPGNGKSTAPGGFLGRSARGLTRKVINASKANGASESGLTALIWNQVLSYGTDAMITVALAGTVFFGASAHAQRGNVLLYLLVTMAPFAVVAPVIGPLLDRLQHGRRWTMAATGVGRAVLSLIMAAHSTELLVLYPCALGSLVFSKAYGVLRAAAAPRLVPKNMTLTEANARISIFGLGSTLVLGGLVGVIIKVTGSYTTGLIVTALGFLACAFSAMRLPKQVDSAAPAPVHPNEPARPKTQQRVMTLARIHAWARRGFAPHVVVALQAESVLRLMSGLLTIFLAFYVESTYHGFDGVLYLGLVIGAAGVGNFVGTAIGTRLTSLRPETLLVISVCSAAAMCLLVAAMFGVLFAAVGMLVASIANSLSKVALDSLIQRDVVETLRSSAFSRSETFLQLAWVIGAAIGVLLPSQTEDDGALGFLVAGIIAGAVAVLVLLRTRATRQIAQPTELSAPRRTSAAPSADNYEAY